MNYRLIVLTHGPGLSLNDCIRSLVEHVTPFPTSAFVHVDGDGSRDSRDNPAYDLAAGIPELPWTVEYASHQRGFCSASAEGWEEAAHGDHEFVLWMEHDFVFTRPVDLTQLAAVLDANQQLAQIAFMRQPVNEQEQAVGGVVGRYAPGSFEPRGGWLEHPHFWTTNPSLFPRQLAARHPWPREAGCEGLFGIRLRELGYSFGYWGSGEPWVEHVGVRDGVGY